MGKTVRIRVEKNIWKLCSDIIRKTVLVVLTH